MSDYTVDTVAEIQSRLVDQVPSLNSVQDAVAMANLIEKRVLPQRLPAAFVLLPSFSGTENGRVGGGIIDQTITENISVVIIHSSAGDTTGSKSRAALHQIKKSVINALVGWKPSAEHKSVITLAGGELSGIVAGAVYETVNFNTDRRYRVFIPN